MTISDFDLATYLMCCGILYQEIVPVNYKRAQFEYEDNQALQERMDDFWKGKALVEPRSFTQARKTIKAHFESINLNQQDVI